MLFTPINLRVVCFYVNLDPRTRESIEAQTPDAEFIDTSGDDYAYWRELKKVWTSSDDILVIEQDIGLRGGEIGGFTACEESWCVCTYPYGALSLPDHPGFYAMGCTKFSASFRKKSAPIKRSRWDVLDQAVMAAITKTNRKFPHFHSTVDHFHFPEVKEKSTALKCWKCGIPMTIYAHRQRCERCGIMA